MKKLLLLLLLIVLGSSTLTPMNSRAQDDGSQSLRQPISVDNVRQIRELATLGYGEISDFAWSPDGDLLVVATSTGIWSFSDFSAPPRQFALAETRVTSIAFSPDGTQLAATTSGVRDDFVSIIDVETGEVEKIFDIRTGTEQIAYHPTLPILIVGAYNEVRIFQLDNGVSIRLDNRSAPPFAISRSGDILVTYGLSSLNVWNVEEILDDTEAEPRIITLPDDKQFADKMVFLPDDNLLLKHFDIVDIGSGEFVDQLSVRRSSTRTVTVSPDGQWIIAPNQSQFSVFDAVSVQRLFDVTVDLAEPLLVKLHPENNQFAAHTAQGIVVGQLDVDEANRIFLPLMSIMPQEIAFTPDQSRLVISARNGDILVWDMQSRDRVETILTATNTIWRMSINADGRWLTGLSRIWQEEDNGWLVRPIVVNLETHEEQILEFDGALQVEFDNDETESVYVVDPNGLHQVNFVTHEHETIIAVGQPPRGASEEIGRMLSPNQSLFLANRSVWDVQTGEVLWTFDISLAARLDTTNWYQALEFSPDSTKLMIKVGFTTQFLYLWDMQTGEGIISQRLRLDTCDIAFSPIDSSVSIVGQIWASGGGGDVAIWNYGDEPIMALQTSTVISCIPALFTSDGSLVIRELELRSGVATGLNFWNPDSRLLHHRIWVFGDTYLASTILSHDDTLLAIATYSGVIRIYGMPLNSECYLTTTLSVNRRERPTVQSRIIGNLNDADIEFPSEIWIDAEGMNWWHLGDESWVNGDFVDVSEGCNSISIAAIEE